MTCNPSIPDHAYHYPVDLPPRQTLQHAVAFLTDENGEDQTDPAKVAVAKRLIRSAMLALTVQGWRPQHTQGAGQ